MEIGDETDETEPDPVVMTTELAELSLNSVVGISSPKTMKLRGRMMEHDVVVLIDSGASHDFISIELVRKLSITLQGTTGYGVLMGVKITVKGEGICKGLKIQAQNLEIVSDFLPLNLGSADVILGMQWLETLGNKGELEVTGDEVQGERNGSDPQGRSQSMQLSGISPDLMEGY